MTGSRLGGVLASCVLALPATPAQAVVIAYCGYIGGGANDAGTAVAVDAAGSAYVAGTTSSAAPTFPVLLGPDTTYNGQEDAFVGKVRVDGTGLVYLGYVGGDFDPLFFTQGNDQARGIAIDAAGRAYLGGSTQSNELTFPVVIGPDLTLSLGNTNSQDAFVARVRADGTALEYCGYVGGPELEEGFALAADAAGSAYVTGGTASNQTTFPVATGPDLSHNGGYDAFVAKVRTDGTALVYAGYIGGAQADEGNAIAVDANGNAHIAGDTESDQASFPVAVGPDVTFNDANPFYADGLVAKVNASGTGLDYAGYVGGNNLDVPLAIAVDGAGNDYLTGGTNSMQPSFPVTVGPDLTFNGPPSGGFFAEAFVARVHSGGTRLDYCGYIGGASEETGLGIAVDAGGNTFVAGRTGSSEATFPVLGGPDVTFNGVVDAFVAGLPPLGTSLVFLGYVGGPDNDDAGGIGVDAAGNAYVAGMARSDAATFPVRVGPDLTHNGGGDAYVLKLSPAAASCATTAARVGQLRAVKRRASLDDVDLAWALDPVANGYNVWYVTLKPDVPSARQATSPPAVPVAGCAVPTPAPSNACTDRAAVSRGTPTHFYYQIRTYCDPLTEGP